MLLEYALLAGEGFCFLLVVWCWKRGACLGGFKWFGMLLGFEATSALCVFGVSVCVLCSGVLVLFVVLVALGCGVVVWELYSEREHLADEMSWAAMSCGGLVFESCPCDFVDCFCCSLLEGCDRIFVVVVLC